MFRGAYGVVWKATDKRTGEVVAVKKCFDAFVNSTDAQRTFREIMYLQELSSHENIINLLNVLKSSNDRDIYVVTDFMESDLHAVIKANILEPIHKQYIVYQILRGLKYMHSGKLVHRDCKPSNVLLNADCGVKLCDFGLARSVNHSSETSNPIMTDYVATRWYRSPEILLGASQYSFGVDVWAVGCILGELILGKPLFPGSSTINQLDKVIELIGFPTSEDIESIESPFARTMLESLHRSRVKNFKELMPNCPTDALDLIKKCLQFNPKKRITVQEALEHPYVKDFHVPSDEPHFPNPPIKISLDDDVKLSVNDYIERIYAEVSKKRKELRKTIKEIIET